MIKIYFLILFTHILIYSPTLNAQWSKDPYNNLIVGYGLLPELCSDSAGGCYITYEQGTTYPRHLILERLNRYGYKPWGSGKRITGEFTEQCGAKIVEAGQNGVIIAYLDAQETGLYDRKTRLRVQRVDSSGNFLWGADGVRVSLSETNQYDEEIVTDGQSGCIVAWKDTMNMLRVQRIIENGTRVWGDSGSLVTYTQEKPTISFNKSIGLIIHYYINGTYQAQRINLLGQFIWGNGNRIPTGGRVIKTDDNGFSYFLGGEWLGYKNKELLFTINLQKVDSNGVLSWDSIGIVLDTLNTNYYITLDFTIQNGYSSIVWPQLMNGIWDIRTQIVRSDGSTVFAYGGRPLRNITSLKDIVSLIPSDSSTTVFVWTDNRISPGIYSQRFDTLGLALWDSNDIALCKISLGGLKLASDLRGGCILVGWRETDFTVRAQQVNKYGQLGEVLTAIENITEQLPRQVHLFQNYPNPFNSSTIINYQLQIDSWVTLKLYNTVGQEIKTIVDEMESAGYKSVEFNAGDLPSGVYYLRIQADRFADVKKMLLIR
jgi:hypothetical protein